MKAPNGSCPWGATGIVRRIGVKNGFSAVFKHSKSEVNFTSLLTLNLFVEIEL